MKKLLSIFVLVFCLSFGNFVYAEDVQPSHIVKDAANSVTEIQTRLPSSKKELAMKFLMAMLGVGASSVMIYVLLSIYNRFIYGTTVAPQQKTEDDEYKTPTNMKDALDIFLKKTK